MDSRRFKDSFSTISIRLSLIFVNAIAFTIAVILFIKAKPIIAKTTLSHLLFSTSWHPIRGDFGFFPFIIGTLEVTAIAMILAVPVCLLSAIYLSEYAHKRFRAFVRLVVDILAGIPSVIYGLCGVIAIVPLVRILGQSLGSPTTGYSLLAGGIILAIMVAPVIISVALEVFRTI
ncbi:MAG: phosphate transporter, permease protein PstC, partial [Nitrospirae bacterium]|nr:phosphate transporter, permease protein PstC [Nitrospirota bacterium]